MNPKPFPHLLVIGTAAVDLTARVPALPQPGETLSLRQVRRSPGGKALNVARVARRLGARVSLGARVGQDAQGEYLTRLLEQEGIGREGLEVDAEHPTATSVITLDAQGENLILTLVGASEYLQGNHIDFGADAVVVQPEFELEVLERLLSLCKSKVVLNLAPYRALPNSFFGRVDTLIVNQVECVALLGSLPTTAGQLLAQVKHLGNLALVMTLGSRGSLLVEAGQVIYLSARAVQAIDTVGAGDALVAGYALGLALGEPRVQALRLGTEAAAFAVQGVGVAEPIPDIQTLQSACEQNPLVPQPLEADQVLPFG